MASSKKGTARVRKIGRDAKTGQIIPVAVARRRKATATVETVRARPRKRRK